VNTCKENFTAWWYNFRS